MGIVIEICRWFVTQLAVMKNFKLQVQCEAYYWISLDILCIKRISMTESNCFSPYLVGLIDLEVYFFILLASELFGCNASLSCSFFVSPQLI